MTTHQFERNRSFFRQMRVDNRRTMLTGKVQDDGSVTLTGAPTNKTWVRDTVDSRRSIPAWGLVPTANVPVVVDINTDGELEIVGTNWVIGTPMWDAALQGVSAPSIQGDVQALNVSAQNIMPGRLQPSGAGGLNVQAVGFHLPGGFWRGGALSAIAQGGLDQTSGDLDLASNVPGTADQVRWVRVYYNPETDALAAANGTAVVQSVSDLDEDDIQDIAIPAGAYPVGAVALSYGQTDFNTASQVRFAPARYFLSPEGHLLTGDAATHTIASGVITVGSESIVVAAAQSGTSDDLDTLTVNTPRMGWIVADTGDTITIKHGVDNISCFGGSDVSVTDADAAVWMYDGTTVFVAGGGGGALDDLSDVDAAAPTTGDVLIYGGSAWEATALSDAVGNKIRLVASVLYNSIAPTSGRYNFQDSAFADYDRIEIFIENAESDVNATSDNAYLLLGTGGGALDTTTTNYFTQFAGASNAAASVAETNTPIGYVVSGSSASTPAGYATSVKIILYNPGDTSFHKRASIVSVAQVDSGIVGTYLDGFTWRNTGAVDRIGLQIDGDPTNVFTSTTRVTIIGYKQEAIGGIAYSTADVSNPPTDAELDSAFGAPATLPVPFTAIVNDNDGGTNEYLVWSDGTSWFYVAGTVAS